MEEYTLPFGMTAITGIACTMRLAMHESAEEYGSASRSQFLELSAHSKAVQ